MVPIESETSILSAFRANITRLSDAGPGVSTSVSEFTGQVGFEIVTTGFKLHRHKTD